MLAWLPSLISLIIGLLGQVNAADWVAQHPNVAMGLGTLGALVTALTRSPIQSAAPSPGSLGGFRMFAVVLLAFGCAAPAFALDVTVTGTQVSFVYAEPSTNPDGSALSDLRETRLYMQLENGMPEIGATVPASRPQGGGRVTSTLLVPVLQNQEANVTFWATALDLVGNESARSVSVVQRIDRLAPNAPE